MKTRKVALIAVVVVAVIFFRIRRNNVLENASIYSATLFRIQFDPAQIGSLAIKPGLQKVLGEGVIRVNLSKIDGQVASSVGVDPYFSSTYLWPVETDDGWNVWPGDYAERGGARGGKIYVYRKRFNGADVEVWIER